MNLPAGVWYDAPNRRFRVRRYRNARAYLVGYFANLDDALAAKQRLDAELAAIPAQRRADRTEARVPPTRFAAFAAAALDAT